MKSVFQVFSYALFSAVLLSVAIPNEILPFGSPLIGLVSLVPLYLALARAQNYREAAFAGAVQFCVTHLLSSFWLAFFKDFAIFTLGLTAVCYLVAGGLVGLCLKVAFAYSSRNSGELREQASLPVPGALFRVLFFAFGWTVHEWGKSTGFLAYPWGTLVQTAYRFKLVTQVVALTGTWGLSFLFSLFSAVLAECILTLPRAKATWQLRYAFALCTVLFTATVVYGTVEYTKERVPQKYLNTVIVQQNGDSWTDNHIKLLERSQRLTAEAVQNAAPQEPDLVVWSETVLSYLLPDSWYWYHTHPSSYPLAQSIQDTGAWYLIGAPWLYDEEKEQFQNAAVLFNSNADIEGYHAKIHLVPFAESIPYIEQPWMQAFMEKLAGFSSSWTSGKEYAVLDVPLKSGGTVSISAPICFEDAFSDVCRQLFLHGSEVFVNITNDAWSQTNSAEIQHFVIASYRAQEFRTTLVRSTNAGYSVVVDPAGKILCDIPLFTEASVFTKVPVYERKLTPYAVLGDWLPLCAAVGIALLLLQAARDNAAQKNSFLS